MIKCTKCRGDGAIILGGQHRRQTVTCTNCNGLGAVDGPQEERLIEAVEKVAEELKNIRLCAEREARRGHT